VDSHFKWTKKRGAAQSSYLSDRWFPFGSDGGGEMLCFDLNSGNDGIFWMPYIGMSDKEAMLQHYTFKDIGRAISDKRPGLSTR